MKTRKSLQIGLSLVELLIVAAIIALALIPILTLVSSRTNQAIGTGNNACAHNHLLNLLRRQESKLYAMAFSKEAQKNKKNTTTVNWGVNEFKVDEEISIAPCTELSNLWKLRVTVRWQERRGSKTIDQVQSLLRLVANPLPYSQER